ncbi:nitrilase family protein [Flavobacterium sp. SE-s28]|uniref:Omega-amidase YafV n=1 Tax=Flavobacterium silvaticum TaxID=1852020 RepID=A0A972JHZ5_9FLAO|nr:nitrilase family protein [Flavobacterium silvaticum]
MNVGVLQMKLEWENPSVNRNFIDVKLAEFQGELDLLVLPEMFSTGFTMKPESVAETMDGETVQWMKRKAAEYNISIAGSLVISENGNFYNRLIVADVSGNLSQYDKRHLFTLSGENERYTSGNNRVIVKVGAFRICLQICYDLRFPAFSRFNDDYDALVYVANWPAPRILAWETLLKARAIENISYVIGVNRIGSDPNGLEYTGQSQIVDFAGNALIQAFGEGGIFVAQLDKTDLDTFRKKFGFLDDRDEITVR